MDDGKRLAYFVAIKEGASYLGGLLITNSIGIPLDFRYTEPITPTKLQSLLYGRALEPHIKGEVIQKALMKEVKSPPDLMFVQASDLADDFAGAQYPILSIQRTQDPPLDSHGTFLRHSPRELSVQIGESGHPLRVLFPQGVEEGVQESVIKTIAEAGYQIDLAEPMERVLGALHALMQQ